MTAYLFPGFLDTAWSPGELATQRPDLYEAACSAVGSDPFLRAYEDTRFEQPALVALSLARWAECDRPPAVALLGYSSGELAALAIAGCLSSVDAIWLAAVRGRLMSDAAGAVRLAALALHGTTVTLARQFARSHELTIVSDRAPDEIVVAGTLMLVQAAVRTAARLGIEAVAVPRHRAFPAPQLSSARVDWVAALHAADIRPPRLPVFSCATVHPVVDARASLAQGLTGAVRVRQTRSALQRRGVGRILTIGGDGDSARTSFAPPRTAGRARTLATR